MKVALLHDWLTGMRGGERCLEAFLALYPEADVFSLIHVPGATSPQIDARVRGTSYLQRFPQVKRYYRLLLPLFPSAVRQFDLSDYDLVISISHAAVKNVRVSPRTTHLCYCLTPMRYVWDQAQTYFGSATPLLWPILRSLRSWDARGSAGVSRFVAISRFVAARIRCFYHRDSAVIYPPIDPYWSSAPLPTEMGEAFLYAGALVPYKGADQAVDTCTRMGLPLWVVGDGPERSKLERRAGPTVQFKGRVSDAELRQYYQRCRALIFPAREDFGMIPLECMAAGRPVLAPFEGATKETLIGLKPWRQQWPLAAGAPNGVFFQRLKGLNQATISGAALERCSLSDSLGFFQAHEQAFQPEACRAWASEFGLRRFYREWLALPELERFRGEVQYSDGASSDGANSDSAVQAALSRHSASGKLLPVG